MKKLIILVVTLGMGITAFANTTPDIKIEKMADAKKFSIELANIEPGAATVTLLDARGVSLLTEKTGEKYYGKVFNLANLPTGDYELVISTATRDVVQPLELTFDGIEMNEGLRKVYFAPIILTNKTNTLDISYFRGKITDVNVAIYRNNELVFEEDHDSVIKVERRYDLSSLPKGHYNVLISTDYKSYYQELVVQ